MPALLPYIWLIPVLPLLAAGVLALTPRDQRRLAAALAISAMGVACLISCVAFAGTLFGGGQGHEARAYLNFPWFVLGDGEVRLGWVLDPLSASMLVMVTFVGTLIFIYSVGYMGDDENFTRFFCFLSLFAAAMLGLVLANSLLLLFICWELVGLASYLLIGFWYHKPEAAAAAKKAFIVTRVGDLGFFLGLLWLYAETGTLLFYDGGQGCLEQSALSRLVTQLSIGGMTVATLISLLIFCGAIGKSGQVPLHVWLPDAMEGPTPVSALIHAATMVAAGVFLVARVYPLMDADPLNVAGQSPALTVVTWLGAVTAVFAASIAIAQTDIKRILAYSTVSQLGYMMLGLGVGGVAVGMFHLLTHAFFKALLFLGAGSVIHGCHEEQDIRYLGGVRRWMPVTFATYAVGMMALAGVPLLFSGFWSKDEILHSAFVWAPSRWPFYLGAAGAMLTAFYMTRQMAYVFFGESRFTEVTEPRKQAHRPHESPQVMTVPLVILAVATVLLTVIGTPFWPWLHAYLVGHLDHLHAFGPWHSSMLAVMAVSILMVAAGVGLGWWWYLRQPLRAESDPLERAQPDIYALLRARYWVDELYAATIIRLNGWAAYASDWLDRFVWGTVTQALVALIWGAAWLNRLTDEFLVNLGFDKGCDMVRTGAQAMALWQNGRVQRYLRAMGLGLVLLALLFLWGRWL